MFLDFAWPAKRGTNACNKPHLGIEFDAIAQVHVAQTQNQKVFVIELQAVDTPFEPLARLRSRHCKSKEAGS